MAKIMGFKQRRRIVRFGAVSRGVVLPKGWMEFYNLRDGDNVTILGNSVLIVCHPGDEPKARKVLELLEIGGFVARESGVPFDCPRGCKGERGNPETSHKVGEGGC